MSYPLLMLNEEQCRRNIAGMAAKARKMRLRLRPHFKTHQSASVAQWFRQQGVTSCTVSSLVMAEYFAINGWDDICISTPVSISESKQLLKLASEIQLFITLCDEATLHGLPNDLSPFAGIWIKTDTGAGRAGIPTRNFDRFDGLIAAIQRRNGRFLGFLAHDGHTYQALSPDDILRIRIQSNRSLLTLKNRFAERYPDIQLSVGDTPSCSLSRDFGGMDEIRPGNFVFYDLMQWNLQVCKLSEIALHMHCELVSMHQSGHAIAHCGAVHLSKDFLKIPGYGEVYGMVFTGEHPSDNPEENAWIISLSQEHAKISGSNAFMRTLEPGQLLKIIPVHACLAAAAMGGYHTTSGTYLPMLRFH